MALIACKECGNEVSTEAKTCPKCGARTKPRSKAWMWVVGTPVAVFIVFAFIGANDPEIQAMQRDRRVIDTCLAEMNDPLTSASTREAMRSFCGSMRDDFIRKHGRAP